MWTSRLERLASSTGWDTVEGEIPPKSRAGVRQVFVLHALGSLLAELIDGREADAFRVRFRCFPFDARATERRARRLWSQANDQRPKRAEECRDGG